MALFKPALMFKGLYTDLRAIIGQTIQTKETVLFFKEKY
jgi:hypothetical protein